MANVALCSQLNGAQQGLLWSEAHKSLLLLTHPLGIAVGLPPSGCPFHHVSLMGEVEDSRLSQPYAERMWKLQALGSLSVLLNVVFGHPQRGTSFSCSSPAVLCQSACERHTPEQGWGIHQAQCCG